MGSMRDYNAKARRQALSCRDTEPQPGHVAAGSGPARLSICMALTIPCALGAPSSLGSELTGTLSEIRPGGVGRDRDNAFPGVVRVKFDAQGGGGAWEMKR